MSLAPSIFAESEEICPKLPKGSGWNWVQTTEVDFDICTAKNPESATTIGVYLGNHPKLESNNFPLAEKTLVGGYDASWRKTGDSKYPFKRDAIITIEGTSYSHISFAHIWIIAGTESELNEAFKLMENLDFGRDAP